MGLTGDTVTLTLGAGDGGVPPGGGVIVGYAMTGDALGILSGGQPGGRHGQLRDFDPLVGIDAETLTVTVTSGSPAVAGAFYTRDVWDRVRGSGLPADTVVVALDPAGTRLTLSRAWTGTTGSAQLTLWHDQRNYAVSFHKLIP